MCSDVQSCQVTSIADKRRSSCSRIVQTSRACPSEARQSGRRAVLGADVAPRPATPKTAPSRTSAVGRISSSWNYSFHPKTLRAACRSSTGPGRSRPRAAERSGERRRRGGETGWRDGGVAGARRPPRRPRRLRAVGSPSRSPAGTPSRSRVGETSRPRPSCKPCCP